MALGFRTGGMFGRQPLAMPAQGAMPIGVEQMQQKPGFFQRPGVKTAAGILGDTLLTLGGGQPMFGPMMHDRRMQEEDARLRQQLVQQQRMQKREDMQWEWKNKPKDSDPYRWKANDGSLMEVGPDGQPRIVYKDPNKRLEYRQGPDGRFYPIDTADAPLPTFTEDDWNNAGGSVGNGAGGFR